MTDKISIIGLGNYGLDELPLGIYKFLQTQETIYVRTMDHPVIEALASTCTFRSFDDVYEQHDGFEAVYADIVSRLIDAAKAHGHIVYAVPGHPRVAETTTALLLAHAADDETLDVEVHGGKSFIDDVFAAVNVDPNDGFTLLDGTALRADQLNVRTHTLITQVYSAMVAADLKITLMEKWPDDATVHIVDGAKSMSAQTIACPLYELDHHAVYGNLTSVFVPKVTDETALYSDFAYAAQVIDTLVDDEKGCLWDKEQTHDTLKRYLLEETFELFEAIDAEDDWHMIEELGDILLQVLLHASIGKKAGYMDVSEIVHSLTEKMIRRHPHIFSDDEAAHVDDVKSIWASVKADEGKVPRVKFEKVFAEHFLKLYEATKGQSLDEAALRQYLEQGVEKS